MATDSPAKPAMEDFVLLLDVHSLQCGAWASEHASAPDELMQLQARSLKSLQTPFSSGMPKPISCGDDRSFSGLSANFMESVPKYGSVQPVLRTWNAE